ncbi:MAG: hypothetical protein ACK595_14160, partial [Planctomycetota bacterium]
MEAANEPLPRGATGTAWRRPDARALATSALVGGLGGVAAFAAATDALLDDGPQLVAEFGRPDGLPLWFHVLYFPAAALLRAAGVAPVRALLLVSVLATAMLLACVHAAAFVVTGQRRARRCRRRRRGLAVGARGADRAHPGPCAAGHRRGADIRR